MERVLGGLASTRPTSTRWNVSYRTRIGLLEIYTVVASGRTSTPWLGAGPALCDAPRKLVQERVPLLFLYRDASHGLDLSFLTHIFLLEPVRDSSLLEQVVSRANRVGATRSVLVETITCFAKNDDDTDDDDAAADDDADDGTAPSKRTARARTSRVIFRTPKRARSF